MKLTMERFTTRRLPKHSQKLNLWLAAALIIGQIASFIAFPHSASAALSADPNEEIIYIDENGVIRVLDLQGEPLVQWFSPTGEWNQIVLIDVNNDGDNEILALKNLGGDRFRVEIFDPVVAFGAMDPNKQINGIPWDSLWAQEFDGDGEYVVAGNFDDAIPGDEFVFGYMSGDTSIVEIWNAASLDSNGKPTGRDMKQHIRKEFPDYEYTFGVAGNLDGEGVDELILFDQDSTVTRMDIYRPDRDLALGDTETSSNDRFKFGATGQIIKDGPEELAAILTVSRPTRPSLRVYTLGNNFDLEEDALWAFAPQPEWGFLADIRGNGDDEVFFLRNYPEGSDGARLIMRDDWGDDQKQNQDLIEWSLMEDGSKNEFRAGAGGDIDGDGRDEIVLLRDDRIRVYHRPETGNEGSSNFNDYMVNTDNRRTNLLVGDLDVNGFTTGPILLVSGNLIEARVPAGTVSQESIISVSNIGTDGNVGVNAIIPGGNTWAKVTPVYSTTPATFRVSFDATSLSPGDYSTTMTLRTNLNNVQNDNYIIYLNLTVVPPILEPTPGMLSIYQLPCASNPCSEEEIAERAEPITTTIRVNGSSDLNFNATIIGVPTSSSSAAAASASGDQLANVANAEVNADANIVVYDSFGNSQVIGFGAEEVVRTAAVLTATVGLEKKPSWIISATVDGESVPSNITVVLDPTVLTEDYQREYALLVLVADTRAGLPDQNMTVVPIELSRVGDLLWITTISKK